MPLLSTLAVEILVGWLFLGGAVFVITPTTLSPLGTPGRNRYGKLLISPQPFSHESILTGIGLLLINIK
jgi:hypothetical protein